MLPQPSSFKPIIKGRQRQRQRQIVETLLDLIPLRIRVIIVEHVDGRQTPDHVSDFLAFPRNEEADLLATLVKHGYAWEEAGVEVSVPQETLEGAFGGVFVDEFGLG
jgi:hypothetical protein